MRGVSERFVFTGDDLGGAYSAAVDAILDGQLIVLPTDTVYGIAADAFKPDAVQRLLDAKGRGRDMPPPVLISAVETLDALATSVGETGRALCEKFWPGALTVICHAQTSLMWDLGETKGTVALRVPDHEQTRELLSRTGPLAVSSANVSGKPAATDVYDAERQLGESVRVYLDGGPVVDDPDNALASTIVDLTGDVPRIVRLGAISLDQLREVAPDIQDPDAPPATDDEPADTTDAPASDTTDEEQTDAPPDRPPLDEPTEATETRDATAPVEGAEDDGQGKPAS
jgi:L-threonylcarbamoyladenylate synthase